MLETRPLDSKREEKFLDWKQHFYIRNNIFWLERKFLGWKQNFYIKNKTFRLETRSLD